MSKYKRRICFFIGAVFSLFLFIVNYDYLVVEQAFRKGIDSSEIKAPLLLNNSNSFYAAKLHQINYLTNLHKANQSVWSSDRGKHFSRAEKAIQQYMNSYPVDGDYWLELLSIQYQVDNYAKSLNWAIAQNLKWNSWNNDYMLNIAFYCVQNWQLLPAELQTECGLGMRTLLSNKYYRNRLMGIVKKMENWVAVFPWLNN